LAVTLAQETPSDAEIGWQLAELAWVPQVEMHERSSTWVRDHSRRDGIYWKEIPAVGPGPVVVLSPREPVGKKRVQRRIATGEQLLNITLPDRQPAATALRGALRRAEAAWVACDKRYSKIVRAGGDPGTDVMLLRLTAECWRIAAEVAQAMPLQRWRKADVFAGRAIAQEPRDRAAEIEREADRIARRVGLRELCDEYCTAVERERKASRWRLAQSLAMWPGSADAATHLQELCDPGCALAPDTNRMSVEDWALSTGFDEIRSLLDFDRPSRDDVWGRRRLSYDDKISTSGGSRRRNVATDGSIDLLLPTQGWERAIERAADAAAR
jgi:hypothetical protein